jgi:hypothetical protein
MTDAKAFTQRATPSSDPDPGATQKPQDGNLGPGVGLVDEMLLLRIDALPLLAFTVHGLLEWPSNKSLTLDGCKALGDARVSPRSKTRRAGRRQGAGRGEAD